MAKETTWMAKTATTELLNNRVAALMREREASVPARWLHLADQPGSA